MTRGDDMFQIAVALFVFFAGSPFAFAGPLHDAARDGDLQKVRALIDEGAVIDAQSDRGETPLILATLAGQKEVVELLIEQGAATDGRNEGGFTPLHAAAYSGDAAIAELLIAKGADINDAENKAGVTPLFPAIEEDHEEVAELLITQGADLSSKEKVGYAALTRALFKGNEGMVILLRAHGAECQSDVLSEPVNQACLAAGK
jgi:ankyrin repeat protein